MDYPALVLDKFEYDTIIFGTGFLESCISAILSTQKNSCLILDLDSSYSSGIKTCNLKEFPMLMNKIKEEKEKQQINGVRKQWNYIPLEMKLPEGINTPSEMKLGMYKNFNLDLNAKFLQSVSPAVTLLQNADMDKYMDFSALQAIQIYCNDKFEKVPETKGEIFSSQSIGILEKRSLWKCLGALIDAGRMYKQEIIDVNSTEEWDKDIDGGNICKQFEEENCFKFFESCGNSQRVNEIILYVIAGYEQNAKIKEIKTKEVVERVHGYVKSLGVHSSFPYLYTNYGTGDIAQGFSRISAVHGGIFILNEDLKITKIEECSQDGKESWKVYSPLAGDHQFLTCKSIVVGAEYKESIHSLIQKEEVKINVFEVKQKQFMLRGVFVFNNPEENKKEPYQCPSIWIIPPEIFKQQKHSITVMSFNCISNSVPKDKFCLQYKTILGTSSEKMEEVLFILNYNVTKKEAQLLANQINQFLINKLSLDNYQIHFSCNYIQILRQHSESNFISMYYLPDDDFSLFLDNYIPVLNNFLSNYFPVNYLHENPFKKVDQEEKKEKEPSEEDEDLLSQLIGNLKELEIKEGEVQEEDKKEEENQKEKDQNYKEQNNIEEQGKLELNEKELSNKEQEQISKELQNTQQQEPQIAEQ